MANQINIDIGAAANDGTGDPLRTAFNYVNLNFANVWATGLPNSNVQFNNNRVLTVNTNANLVLAPNGTGVVQSNVSIVPNTDRVHSLGSAGKKWYSIYANYLDIDELSINADLYVGGNLTVEGDTIQIGNIVTDTKTIQLANTAANTAAANGSGITVGANDNIATLLYNASSNVWTTNIGISAVGNITALYFIGNGALLTGITSYANANVVAYGESGWAGNIIPSGNAIYSLGNATNQWNDLYVSNATIFMNNVPISLTAGNVLTVDGEAVLTNDSNTTITTTGNITADYFFGNIQGTSGNLPFFTAQDIYALDPNNGINMTVGGYNNLVVLPTDVLIQNVPLTVAGNIVANETNGLYITANLPVGGTARIWNFDTNGDLTVPNYVKFAGNTFLGDEPAAGTPYFRIDTPLGYPATITTDSDISGNNWSWTFGADGNLILPSNKNIIVDGGDGVIGPVSDDLVISWDNEEIRMVSVAGSIEMQADNAFRVQTNYNSGNSTYTSRWEFNQDEIVNITGSSAIVTEAGDLTLSGGRNGLSSGNTTVRAVNVGVLVADWIFDNAGNLSYPDGTISTGGATYAAANASVQMISNNEYTQVRVDNANVEIYTSPNGITQNQWTYGNTGTFTAPGNITTTGNISATGNVSGDVGLFNDVNVNNAGTNKLLYTDDNRNIYDTSFGYDAANSAISGSGNITAGYFIGDGSLLTGLSSSYGNANVADFLANGFGSNTISTTGNISGNTGGFAIGYRDIPQVAFSANATAALTDAGKHYYSTTAGNLELVLPDNVSVAIPTGATLTIVVNAAGNVLVGQGTGVSLYQAGASATGNRVVGAYGLATVMKVAANTWVISGTGVY